MNKLKELLYALQKVKREAMIQNIIINEISLPIYWAKDDEIVPDKLLGITINIK